MTIFVTRETARDSLVSLFTTNASWDLVFGYQPSQNEINQRGSVLIISSGGTEQQAQALDFNRAVYRFNFMSLVLVADTDADGSWTEANCEDRLDNLDAAIRQVVRTNMGGAGGYFLRFEGGSTTGYIIIGGAEYRTEQRVIIADYPSGGN